MLGKGNANGKGPMAGTDPNRAIYDFLMGGGFYDPRTGNTPIGIKIPMDYINGGMSQAPLQDVQGEAGVPVASSRRPRGGLMGVNFRLGR